MSDEQLIEDTRALCRAFPAWDFLGGIDVSKAQVAVRVPEEGRLFVLITDRPGDLAMHATWQLARLGAYKEVNADSGHSGGKPGLVQFYWIDPDECEERCTEDNWFDPAERGAEERATIAAAAQCAEAMGLRTSP